MRTLTVLETPDELLAAIRSKEKPVTGTLIFNQDKAILSSDASYIFEGSRNAVVQKIMGELGVKYQGL